MSTLVCDPAELSEALGRLDSELGISLPEPRSKEDFFRGLLTALKTRAATLRLLNSQRAARSGRNPDSPKDDAEKLPNMSQAERKIVEQFSTVGDGAFVPLGRSAFALDDPAAAARFVDRQEQHHQKANWSLPTARATRPILLVPGTAPGYTQRETLNSQSEPYLVRWRLVQTPWLAVYLHHILRSDDDRALHDHPWAFVSLILRGGYWEVLPGGRHWRGAGSLVFHRAEDLHRLMLDRPAWTLVLCGRRRREWGFRFGDGWRSWREVVR